MRNGKSGAEAAAVQTLRDCHAAMKTREASGLRAVYRRFLKPVTTKPKQVQRKPNPIPSSPRLFAASVSLR
jgi:hypothetical protein